MMVMKNKTGYILGLVSAFVYTLLNYGDSNTFINFIASFVGALIIPLTLTYIISLFLKNLELGKIFGIASIIIHILATVGKLNS